MAHRIVVALGGNALQKGNENGAEAQKQVAQETARLLARLIHDGHELVIAHGNGPQVGDLLLAQQHAPSPMPLDTCVGMSQGQIGYWLQQALGNTLRSHGLNKPVATVVTQVVVAADDPAFQNPTKPVGQFYESEAMARLTLGVDAAIKEDAGRGWRHVVPSPRPQDIVETPFIVQAMRGGCVVIASGGGGVPVVRRDDDLVGVEAVIDKDFAAAKLAELVDADLLLILTNMPAATINFRQPNETPLGQVTPTALQTYIDQNQFAPGSMLPKVQAAMQFASSKAGRTAVITSIEQALEGVRGTAGTRVTVSS